jgi:hypothetical protein
MCYVFFLCIVVPLPPGTYPLAVTYKNNSNNNKIYAILYRDTKYTIILQDVQHT